MKSLNILLVSAALAVSSTAFASDYYRMSMVVTDDLSEYNTLTWVNQYYKNPQPDLVVRRVQILSEMNYFADPAQAAQAIGLLSKVFAQHPDRVRGWFAAFKNLSLADQRVLASALWLSGHPQANRYVTEIGQRLGSEVAADLTATTPRPLNELAVDSSLAMGLQWGAFVASGDSRYVTNILAAVGSGTPGIAESARFTLALKASQDERVMQICRAELSKQPQAVQEVLRAALNEAPSTAPSS